MTPITAFSQEKAESVQGCHSCPLAQHLDGDRFACADRNIATRGRHAATDECHQAIVEYPRKYSRPLPLPDLQGVKPELICDRIKLNVNWLDPDEDSTAAGETLVEVKLNKSKIGTIHKWGEWYGSDRIPGFADKDAHYIALHLIHPDFLWNIVQEIIADRKNFIDYI